MQINEPTLTVFDRLFFSDFFHGQRRQNRISLTTDHDSTAVSNTSSRELHPMSRRGNKHQTIKILNKRSKLYTTKEHNSSIHELIFDLRDVVHLHFTNDVISNENRTPELKCLLHIYSPWLNHGCNNQAFKPIMKISMRFDNAIETKHLRNGKR